MKIDAEKGEGIELAKQFGVRGFPTIIIANENGQEVDRIVGYMPPEPFLEKLNQIKNGINTLPTLLGELELDGTKFSTLFKLANKYENMNDKASAREMINAILEAGTDSSGAAAFQSILYDARETRDPTPLIIYADKNPDSENSSAALEEAMWFVRGIGDDPDLEADLFIRFVNGMKEPNPGLLNGFAWRMSELEKNLDHALEKVNWAIENEADEKNKHMYIDTKAEVLWKMGRVEEAIAEIEKCISFDSEDKYYGEQLEKFQKSQNPA